MSITEILQKVSVTFINIMNDLLAANSLHDVVNAFVQDDRMMYLGIVIILIAVGLLFG